MPPQQCLGILVRMSLTSRNRNPQCNVLIRKRLLSHWKIFRGCDTKNCSPRPKFFTFCHPVTFSAWACPPSSSPHADQMAATALETTSSGQCAAGKKKGSMFSLFCMSCTSKKSTIPSRCPLKSQNFYLCLCPHQSNESQKGPPGLT